MLEGGGTTTRRVKWALMRRLVAFKTNTQGVRENGTCEQVPTSFARWRIGVSACVHPMTGQGEVAGVTIGGGKNLMDGQPTVAKAMGTTG